MRKLIINFFILYFISLLSSCVNKSGEKHKIEQNSIKKKVELPYEIGLKEKLNHTENIPLSILGKQLKYIVLETSPDCLLRKIDHIVFTDNFIFISDFDALYKFGRDGSFIQKIGKTGRGPGEYRNVFTFALDKLQNKIYLYNWGIMQEYDFDGNYIKSLDVKKLVSTQYIIHNSDEFIFHIGNAPEYSNPIEYSLIVTDTNAKPIASFINYHKRKSKPGITIAKSPFYIFRGQLRFMEYSVDTLYTVVSDRLKPYAIFDLGRFKMNPDPLIPLDESGKNKVLKQLNNKIWIRDILEDTDYLYINLAYGFTDSLKLGIFNKHDKSIIYLNGSGFINDLDGGVRFWPKYIYNDRVLVDYVKAYDFKATFLDKTSPDFKEKYGEKYTKLINIADKLNDESNPVLMIMKR